LFRFQIAVQFDFILEDNFVGARPVQAYARGRFVGGSIGDTLVLAVREPGLVSGRLAFGADHFPIAAEARAMGTRMAVPP
jgi:hypothetical protein